MLKKSKSVKILYTEKFAKEFLATLPEVRKRVFERHYGKDLEDMGRKVKGKKFKG